MSESSTHRIPKGVLVAAAALLLTSLGLAASARGRDESVGRSDAPVSQGVRLRFEDGADGSVVVLDASGARRLATVPPAEGGFVRGVMRGMFRTRKLESIDRTAPFHLLRLSDGALVLEDPTNGRRVDLRSFGDTNYRAFSALLATEPPTAP